MHHHGQADHLGRCLEVSKGVFHLRTLRNELPALNRFSSDTAGSSGRRDKRGNWHKVCDISTLASGFENCGMEKLVFRFFLGSLIFLVLAFPAAADYLAGATAYSDGDYETAHREYLDGAKDEDPRSEFGLAVMYHTGKGVAKDYTKAREWYTKAAERGYAKAQNNLGIMYRRGQGVKRNPREAFTWIWMAAIQGYTRAEMNLAEMYMQGEGVGKDLIMAYIWFEFAVTDLPPKSRDKAENKRNEIVSELSEDEVTRAKRLAKGLRDARK